MQEATGTSDRPTSVGVADFVAAENREAESIDVKISLGIIKRFSEGLYSSPNKTFEELVSNSYDAGAGRCLGVPPARSGRSRKPPSSSSMTASRWTLPDSESFG